MRPIRLLALALAAGLLLSEAATAQTAPGTYSSSHYGFSLLYPAGLRPQSLEGAWSAVSQQGFGSDKGTPVVGITVFDVDHGGVATGQPYPLFFSAEARVGVSTDTGGCYPDVPLMPGATGPADVTINGVTFRHVIVRDAGMMKYTIVDAYRAIHDGRCYSVERIEKGSSYRDDSMTAGISDDQLDAYFDEAMVIVRSFRFTDAQADQASAPGTAAPSARRHSPP